MRLSFHMRQFGDYINGRKVLVFEKSDPWNCRFMIELLRIGYGKTDIPVYADEQIIDYLRETMLEEELADVLFYPYREGLDQTLPVDVLMADARQVKFLDQAGSMESRKATLKIRFEDYPRGGLSPKGESIEKGVWDYETDDLVDIELHRVDEDVAKPARIGVLVDSSIGLEKSMAAIEHHFPNADIRLLSRDIFLPHVTQHLNMHDKVDFVLRAEVFGEDTVNQGDLEKLTGLNYDLMVVVGSSGRHRDYRHVVSFLRRFFPDNKAVGLTEDNNERVWFIVSWLPIDKTWYHFRLRK